MPLEHIKVAPSDIEGFMPSGPYPGSERGWFSTVSRTLTTSRSQIEQGYRVSGPYPLGTDVFASALDLKTNQGSGISPQQITARLPPGFDIVHKRCIDQKWFGTQSPRGSTPIRCFYFKVHSLARQQASVVDNAPKCLILQQADAKDRNAKKLVWTYGANKLPSIAWAITETLRQIGFQVCGPNVSFYQDSLESSLAGRFKSFGSNWMTPAELQWFEELYSEWWNRPQQQNQPEQPFYVPDVLSLQSGFAHASTPSHNFLICAFTSRAEKPAGVNSYVR
jgi:hypothetical protein